MVLLGRPHVEERNEDTRTVTYQLNLLPQPLNRRYQLILIPPFSQISKTLHRKL
jgi:hypothetical protein